MMLAYLNRLFEQAFFLLAVLIITFTAFEAKADSRIKDIVNFDGIRENMLIGYGLVVGLNGTGDNLKNSVFTQKGLTDFLEKLGVNTRGANLKTKNVAAVTVTASLPAFARTGSKISINVSTIGDAKSLKGGTLIATPLVGADGEVYAVSQGAISIGSPATLSDTTATLTPTSGYITNGAIIEREIDFRLDDLSEVRLALKNADITTARAIATAINANLFYDYAQALDPGTVRVNIPSQYKGRVLSLLADIESITIQPDSTAKIVIDEATGTIVIGENVKLSTVAIAQGNLIVKVKDSEEYAYEIGLTKVEPLPSEPGKEIAVFSQNTNLSDLVQGLNSLGVTPKDLISILKTIKQAGALQADIEVR
ncbi:Flagellar P-ring protein [Candidatus Jidaibacter acanthamoeba]|uniref:Flagellar P-ring protein n=2 Tax=Candidatus Jidaibacter acanthamoebae TaxID=86105 RepID=A0A0C1QZH4_9RICK|nr:Flagellar P-ring protein [Candidatus Jidaibacter acanthamoeba]